MNFTRKDLVPITIALVALAVNLGKFTAPRIATGILVIAFILLGVLIFWRTSEVHIPLIEPESAIERDKLKRVETVKQLKVRHGSANAIAAQFVVAHDGRQLKAAEEAFREWIEECYVLIKNEISLGKAEAFRHLGRVPKIDIRQLSEDPNRSDYEWDRKAALIYETLARKTRLTELMGEIDPN